MPGTRFAVEHQPAHLDRRVVGVRPHLGHVERVEAVAGGVCPRHHLQLEAPLGRAACRDRLAQVAAMEVRVLGRQRLRLGVPEGLAALGGLEVELDPEALAAGVDSREGVAAVAVHVARCVADEEDRRVVADQVVVALVGIELEGEAARIAHGVGRPLVARHGGEAGEHRRALADPGQEARPGEPRHVLGDLEEAVGAAALGVDDALGHALAVEVLQLLDDVVVVQNGRAGGPDGQRVLVAGGRDAGVGGGRRRRGGAHGAPILGSRQEHATAGLATGRVPVRALARGPGHGPVERPVEGGGATAPVAATPRGCLRARTRRARRSAARAGAAARGPAAACGRRLSRAPRRGRRPR